MVTATNFRKPGVDARLGFCARRLFSNLGDTEAEEPNAGLGDFESPSIFRSIFGDYEIGGGGRGVVYEMSLSVFGRRFGP